MASNRVLICHAHWFCFNLFKNKPRTCAQKQERTKVIGGTEVDVRRYKRKDVFFFYPGKMLGLTGELSQGVLCCWHLHFPCSKFAGMRSELAGGAEAVIPGWEETFIIHSVWKSLLDAAVNCSSAQKVIKVNIWQQLLQCYVEKSPMLPGIKRQDKFKVKLFFF